ncbi:MAG: DUF2384 domain-containing protein [Balneolia bacterium]|nr:DUF2384 domain-containing protein [Balneolia bacterium]
MDIIKDTEIEYLTETSHRTFLSIARSGLTSTDFMRLYTTYPFSLGDWAFMAGISERSLQRYIKTDHTFSIAESEKLLRLSHLLNRGLSVFGDQSRFFQWLKEPSVAFSGDTPFSLLDTIFGIDIVLDELGRIEHGILA